MIFRRKKKNGIPRKSFDAPLKYRFTFVPEGWSYFDGKVVTISATVHTKKRAFFIASEVFSRDHGDKAKGSVAVFYGDTEAPDCMDSLYSAYNAFDKRKKR